MGYLIRFRSSGDVEDYKHAGKKAKYGVKLVMDGLEDGDKAMIMEGAEKVWDGVKTMCDISDEMEAQFGERRSDYFTDNGEWRQRYNRRGVNYRHEDDWNQRDDEWMERRMRDSRGRFK